MYLTGTPSRAATAAAMSGETPEGSPFGSLPLTKRKFPMLIAARKTPVGASSETICCEACTGIGGSVREGEGGGILKKPPPARPQIPLRPEGRRSRVTAASASDRRPPAGLPAGRRRSRDRNMRSGGNAVGEERMAGLEVKSVHLLGTPVSYAYAVKAGPWIFLTGHEAFDFASGIPEEVAGPPGFPLFGRPRSRREGDFILGRLRRILQEFGAD